MPGLPVVECLAEIIGAFRASADAMKRMKIRDAKQKPAGIKMLENEVQLSLEKGRDELTRYKEWFVADCGCDIPPKEPFFSQFLQLNKVKSNVENIRDTLDTLLKHGMPLSDPGITLEDAFSLRFTAIQAVKELREHMQAGTGTQSTFTSAASSYPPISCMPASSSMQDQRHAYSPPRHDIPHCHPWHPTQIMPSSTSAWPGGSHSGRTASSPSIPQELLSIPRSSCNSNDFGRVVEPGWQDNIRLQAQNTSSLESSRPRAATWASEEASSRPMDQLQQMSLGGALRHELGRGLTVEPPNTSSSSRSPNRDHRDSVTTFNTTSSGTSNELVPSPSKSRRKSKLFGWRAPSRHDSEIQQSTIEHVVGEVRSDASAENDWHGFCRGTFQILENPLKGLEVVQRPWQSYSTKQYLQCKYCAFPGNHCGKKAKPKVPDVRVMESANGIRYRWMFLAKSHVKSTEGKGGIIDVEGQIARSAYRCNFCYLEGILPHKLGGVETLMNHIWQYHRRKGISDYALRRTSCILGRMANPGEDFDINIPAYDRTDEHDGRERGHAVTTGSGDMLFAGSVELAAVGLGIANGNDESAGAPGIGIGITEISEFSEMGRRGSPIELA